MWRQDDAHKTQKVRLSKVKEADNALSSTGRKGIVIVLDKPVARRLYFSKPFFRALDGTAWYTEGITGSLKRLVIYTGT